MAVKVLIFGLPGSGKTTLAGQLVEKLGPDTVWYNADEIREQNDDWDFSNEGRLRQANRMRDLMDEAFSDGFDVVIDFVCPTQEYRNLFDRDVYKVFMDTISASRYEDTNTLFERPWSEDVTTIPGWSPEVDTAEMLARGIREQEESKMTPTELYAREPEQIRSALREDSGSDGRTWIEDIPECHLPEVDCQSNYVPSDRIQVRIYKDFCFDGRRTWTLASVWFDDRPVMIMQNAGREGHDHEKRFITNMDAYTDMIAFLLKSQVRDDTPELNDVYDANDKIPYLKSFYNNDLDDDFKRYER